MAVAAVTTSTAESTADGSRPDSLILALARYVEALERRYPDGPDQMRAKALDARANMPRMCKRGKGTAA
jgi:hypothetical protein